MATHGLEDVQRFDLASDENTISLSAVGGSGGMFSRRVIPQRHLEMVF